MAEDSVSAGAVGVAEQDGPGLGFSTSRRGANEATPLVAPLVDFSLDEAESEAAKRSEKRLWWSVVAVVSGNSFLNNIRQSMVGSFLPGEVGFRSGGEHGAIMGSLVLAQVGTARDVGIGTLY